MHSYQKQQFLHKSKDQDQGLTCNSAEHSRQSKRIFLSRWILPWTQCDFIPREYGFVLNATNTMRTYEIWGSHGREHEYKIKDVTLYSLISTNISEE